MESAKGPLPAGLRSHYNRQKCGELIVNYSAKLYGLFMQLSGNHHVAEDLVQEGFLRIWRSLKGFRGTCSMSSWIYRIAVNTFYDHVRAESRRPMVTEGSYESLAATSVSDSPYAKTVKNEELVRLAEAVRHLSIELKVPIVLRYYHGLSIRRVSYVTGLSRSQTKYRLNKALDCLRNSLEPRPKVSDANFAEGIA